MDTPSRNAPQPEPSATDNPQPPQPQRRKRTFPVRFLVRKDEKDKVVETRMFYDHEWKEYEAAQQAAERARKEAEDAARAAHQAELAAGRPNFPKRENDVRLEPVVTPTAPTAPTSRSALVASTQIAHILSDIPPDYERHSRRCSICSHPDRDAIEGDFVRWRKPAEIIDEYGVSNRYALYRHAHATGLYQHRQTELARVLEKQLENADDCPLELFDVITRAVRAYAHLDLNGRWFEPARTHHILTGRVTPAEATPQGNVPPGPNLANPNLDPPPAFDVALNLPNPR